MSITVQWESITPALAAKMLEKVHPRQAGRDSASVIRSFSDTMKSGQWNESVAQTVTVDDLGQVTDGYHRLRAIVLSGVTIRLLVARGVPTSAFRDYDSGQARSLSFRLGIDKDTVSIIGVALRIVKYGRINSRVTNAEAALVHDYLSPVIARFDSFSGKTRKARVSSAPIRAAAVLAALRYPSFEDQIFAAYRNLVAVNLTDAPRSMSALYRRLTEQHHPPLMQVALAWKAFAPARFGDGKIQINDMSAVIHDIRRSVLRDLVGAIVGDDAA